MQKPYKYNNYKKAYNCLSYDYRYKWLSEYSKYYRGILVNLGCGRTPYKNFFLQYTDKYIGVDGTNTLNNSKADVISDLNKKIEIKDEFADTIISLSVMEQLCEPQIFLNESKNNCKWIKGSKLRKIITKASLIPFWYIAQKLAPCLDSLHRGWSRETASLFVVASK